MDNTTTKVKSFKSIAAGIVLLLLLCPAVTSAATTWHFDMQDAFGDLQPGYTEIRGNVNYLYDPGVGYGWSDTTISGSTTFNGLHPMAYLLEDRCNASSDRTFSANVDNGSYYVTLYFYQRSYIITNEKVFAEGSEIYSITSLAPDVVEISNPLLVNVSDGVLDLLFSDTDGTRWIISGIDITPVPIPSAIWLLGSAFIGFVGFRRKFRKA